MSTPDYSALIGHTVLAEWHDSHHVAHWHNAEPSQIALTCYSAGLLTYAGDEAITIAGHWTDEEVRQRCGEMTIPASALVSLRALT